MILNWWDLGEKSIHQYTLDSNLFTRRKDRETVIDGDKFGSRRIYAHIHRWNGLEQTRNDYRKLWS